MNKITRHYVESEGLQIHYYKSGDSKNSLLLFHESPQSGQVYLKAFPYLSRDFTDTRYVELGREVFDVARSESQPG